MLGAWWSSVAGVVGGQCVLSEEGGVVLVLFLWFDELAHLEIWSKKILNLKTNKIMVNLNML